MSFVAFTEKQFRDLDALLTEIRQGGGVTDVQVNGTSVVTEGVANVPVATAAQAKAGSDSGSIVAPSTQHASAFYGLAKAAGDSTQSASANAVGTYTESAKSAIAAMLDAPESVSGSTPTIAAKAGVQYVCGECSTLTVTTPATGVVDIVFESGSTPTVLTVTPPTGMTMQWANGFDPTTLEANATYELNVLNGCLGVCVSWA